MKVILMQQIERLGETGQQVEVAEGYARNFLLPRRLAVEATPGNLKSLGQLTSQAKNREDRLKTEAQALAERLTGLEVILSRRASEETVAVPVPAPVEAPVPVEAEAAAEAAETPAAPPAPAERVAKLFGSVTSQDLSEALAARGLAVEKKQILLPEPIKTLGRHAVAVRLHPEVTAEFTLVVEREV